MAEQLHWPQELPLLCYVLVDLMCSHTDHLCAVRVLYLEAQWQLAATWPHRCVSFYVQNATELSSAAFSSHAFNPPIKIVVVFNPAVHGIYMYSEVLSPYNVLSLSSLGGRRRFPQWNIGPQSLSLSGLEGRRKFPQWNIDPRSTHHARLGFVANFAWHDRAPVTHQLSLVMSPLLTSVLNYSVTSLCFLCGPW